MSLAIKKVSELVEEIKDLLETSFANVSVEGEISNLSLSSSGHWYFTLSDKDSSMSAALFKMDGLRNPQMKNIKDGDKVIVAGDINVYTKRGTFQIIVKRIVPVGLGDLKEQFEKLKRKLASEGLFDLDHKKAIPPMPKRVAIITAQRGAALQDFINIYRRRALWMDIVVVPTLVQGDDAPRALRASLHNIIKYSLEASESLKIDLIVLARGGGSLEDLWAFNDEGLAYDIYNCPIPTISAVGHEVDFSICDFVADLRCETPSAAAEVITHQQTLIRDKMNGLKGRLKNVMTIKLSRLDNRVKKAHPNAILSIVLANINYLQKRLARMDLQKRLHELTKMNDFYQLLDENIVRLEQSMKDRFNQWRFRLDKHHDVLGALNPKNVLGRGYGYLEDSHGKIVGSAKDLDGFPKDSTLNLHFHDGTRKVRKTE